MASNFLNRTKVHKNFNRSHNLNFLQLNLNGQYLVAEQVRDICLDKNIDIALLQDFPSKNGKIIGLQDPSIKTIMKSKLRYGRPAAAILVFNTNLEVISLDHLNTRNIAVASIRPVGGKSFVVVSAYFKYKVATSVHLNELDRVTGTINGDILIGADVNAHSDLWHYSSNNRTAMVKGRQVEAFISSRNLVVHNKKSDLFTYSRPGMGSSNIDVTLTSRSLSGSIQNWRVCDNTDSDHRTLMYNLIVSSRFEPQFSRIRFQTSKADWGLFKGKLSDELSKLHGTIEGDNLDRSMEVLTKAIVKSAKIAIPISGRLRIKSKPPWWNDSIEQSKKELNIFKRSKDWKIVDNLQYRILRNKHFSNIKKAKFESWKLFASNIREDSWGPTYKWIKKGSNRVGAQASLMKSDGNFTITAEETARFLLDTLIPSDVNDTALVLDQNIRCNDYILSGTSIKEAIWRIGPNKAPGFDGINAKILRVAWNQIEFLVTRLFQRCIFNCVFPSTWKTAVIVTLLKGVDKDPTLAKSYRPVSLLPTLSKAFETMIIHKLHKEIKNKCSIDQHGFTEGRSTISAMKSLLDWVDSRSERYVIGIFLDISGAFDNLQWNILLQDALDLGAKVDTIELLKNYLVGRRASLTVEKTTVIKDLTRGCPQGSQLGPILWNISMEKALNIHREGFLHINAYADDLAVVVAGSKKEILQERSALVLDRLIDWATYRGLTFSPLKTTVTSLRGGLKPGSINIRFGNSVIFSSSPIRYLGVLIDYKRNFWGHLDYIAKRSDDMYSRMRSIMSANWGTNQQSSLLIYRAVFIPRITYAAEIWQKSLSTKKAIKKLGSSQRRPLLSITNAYKTTSTDALHIISGVLPLDLEIINTVLKQKIKKGLITQEFYVLEYNRLLDIWQKRWDISDKGRWTFNIFPSVRIRLAIPLTLDYYITQLLSGHGDFNHKLFQFKLVDSPLCDLCNMEDTVEHFIFVCPNYEEPRALLRSSASRCSADWPCDLKIFVSSKCLYESFRLFAKSSFLIKKDIRDEIT